MMKTILKTALVLALLGGLFVYFGGGRWLQGFGKKSVEVGERLEDAEKKAKDISKDVGEKAKKGMDRLKKEID